MDRNDKNAKTPASAIGALETEVASAVNSSLSIASKARSIRVADGRSWFMLPRNALMDGRLTGGQFRVLALLWSYRANDQKRDELGWAWPSQDRLAKDLGVSRRSLREHLAKLAQFGWIQIRNRRELHPDFRGNANASAYYLPWGIDRPEDQPPSMADSPPV